MGGGASSKKYKGSSAPPLEGGLLEERARLERERDAPVGANVTCPECGGQYPKSKQSDVCPSCWKEEEQQRIKTQYEEELQERPLPKSPAASRDPSKTHPARGNSKELKQRSSSKDESGNVVMRRAMSSGAKMPRRRATTSNVDSMEPARKGSKEDAALGRKPARHHTVDGETKVDPYAHLAPGELALLKEQDPFFGHERKRQSKASNQEENTQAVIESLLYLGYKLGDHCLMDGKTGAELGIGIVKGPGPKKGTINIYFAKTGTIWSLKADTITKLSKPQEKLYLEEQHRLKNGDGRRKSMIAA